MCCISKKILSFAGGNVGTNILQQAPLPLLSDTACYALYQQANLDTTDDMQCAGGQGKGACNVSSQWHAVFKQNVYRKAIVMAVLPESV